MKKKSFILAILLPFFLIGCSTTEDSINNDPTHDQSGDDSGQTDDSGNNNNNQSGNNDNTDTTVSVQSVSLNKTSLEIYTDDNTNTLTATISPSNATNKNVTWSSGNTGVATVSNGKITPVSAGTTTIKVTTVDGNKTASCALTVKQRVPDYVLYGKFNNGTSYTTKAMTRNYSADTFEYMIQGVTLYANDLFKVHLSGDPLYGYSDVKSSTPSGLVTNGSDNFIKVLSGGTYDLYCSNTKSDGGYIYLAKQNGGGGGGGSNPGTVSVTSISLNRTGKVLNYRYTLSLEATINPSNATDKTVYWSSSDETVATVTNGGTVNATVTAKEKKGSALITAKTADGYKTATCLVYVTATTPEYYLTGTINNRSVTSSSTYPAIPGQYVLPTSLGSGKYLIPDVPVKSGDRIKVTGSNGATLKNKSNQPYEYVVNSDATVSFILNVNDANKNYLSIKN